MPVPVVPGVAPGELLELVRDAQRVEMRVEAAVSVEQAVLCAAIDAQHRQHAAINLLGQGAEVVGANVTLLLRVRLQCSASSCPGHRAPIASLPRQY